MSRPAAPTADPYDLARFVAAQAPVLDRVEAELRAGSKTSHWMWFVFPQIAGLGDSAMSRRYAISGREEAAAYLDHPVLGKRLVAHVNAVTGHADRTAAEILGAVDAAKFRSCVTLFGTVRPDEPAFVRALDRFYGGRPDPETLRRL